MKLFGKAAASVETLVIGAPLRGWATPVEEVSDPVFAGRMLGDGVAVDPVSSILVSPCDATVIGLPASRHAITLRADNGAEILIHVGLETVALGGEGFTAHVSQGDRVRRGDRLLGLDLDLLATRARSLITPLVLTNGEDFEIARRTTDQEVREGDTLLELRARAVSGAAVTTSASTADIVRELVVNLPHGIHARPAARLAARAQAFRSDLQLHAGKRRADLRSAVATMTLGAGFGERLTLTARGPDAAEAVAALEALLETLAREEASALAPAAAIVRLPQTEESPGVLRGTMAAPGLAIGVAVRLAAPEPVVSHASQGAPTEHALLAEALARVEQRLGDMAGGHGGRADILAAHRAFLADPALRAHADRGIDDGLSAGVAWRTAVRASVEDLRRLDARFAERADDLLDLERQVLFALSGEAAPAPKLPPGAVVIAEDLLPSDLIALESARPAGFCTVRGGATSHVAILAAAMGVPALAAVGPGLLQVMDGATVVLDADAGSLRVAPDSRALAEAQGQLARRVADAQAQRRLAAEPGRLADGTRIEVLANLGSEADAAEAVGQGAEGCGLFRTELLYLARQAPPDEAEQAAAYQVVADALAGRTLTIRTLDAGGDKPLAFAPAPPEANPALGLRGIRAGLRQPDLLRTQLAAVLRVQGPIRLLLPMVSEVAEVRAVRSLLAELAPAREIAIGVMVETPAAALLADQLLAEADFLSVGTNDLTQYVLAMDREHAELAPRLDGLHPAVLRLVAVAAEAAQAAGRPASVCGGLASDLAATPLLIGLGVRGLSAPPAVIPALKARLRTLDLAACEAAAQDALALTSADAVRALVRERFHPAEGHAR